MVEIDIYLDKVTVTKEEKEALKKVVKYPKHETKKVKTKKLYGLEVVDGV